MQKIIFTVIFLIQVIALLAQTETSIYESQVPKSTTWYEKIHIHTDRSIYFSGDTLWYKAYLIDCNHQTDTLSNLLYVDFTGADGKILVRQKLLIENGMAHGDIAIDSSLAQGEYSIYAFTSWMLNYSEHHSFRKNINIFNRRNNLNINVNTSIIKIANGDSVKVNFNVNDMNNWRNAYESYNGKAEFLIDYGNNLNGKGTTHINNDGTGVFGFNIHDSLKLDHISVTINANNGTYQEKKKIRINLKNQPSLTFYPEGGQLIDSLESQIALKGLNSHGSSFKFDGVIIDSQNDTVANFNSNKLGMGSFFLRPLISESYTATINIEGQNYNFPLPKIESQGFQLKIQNYKQTIDLEVGHNLKTSKAVNYLIFRQRHKVLKIHRIENPGWLKLQFPKKHFPNGLITCTLSDQNFTPVAERLFYADREEQLNIAITESASTNLAGNHKKISLVATNNKRQSQLANLSVSICEKNLRNENEDHIFSRFNLSSEIKGDIEQPGYYFKNGKVDIKNLDYLLLTQGWRNYLWTDENINTTDTIAYQIEKGFAIEGTVQHRRKRKKITGYQLHMLAQGDSSYFETITIDSTQQFLFNLPLFYNKQLFFLQGKSKKDRKRDMRFLVNESNLPTKHDSLAPSFETAKTNIIDNLRSIKKSDHIKKMVNAARHVDIDEVVVTAKNRLPWYHEEPEVAYNMDSLDPNGDRYQSLFDFLHDEYGAFIEHDTLFREHILMRASGMTSFYDPIFLLDGMVIFDAGEDAEMYDALLAMVNSTPINELKTIKVFEPGNYSAHYANTEVLGKLGIWQSLVELESYDRNFYRGNPLGVNLFTLQGLFKPHEFYIPPFDPFEKDHIPDSRSTIYWNPNLKTDESGTASFELKHFNHQGDLIIWVEGMNEDGSRYGATIVPLGK